MLLYLGVAVPPKSTVILLVPRRYSRHALATASPGPKLRGMNETEVVLVGAGPIGLEMAVALRDAGIDYVHLEAKQVGYTISWYPRQVKFFSSPERISICGVPLMTADQSKASREEYLAYLLGIVRQFQLNVNTYERVTKIEREGTNGSQFVVATERADGQHVYRARKVILTIGDMHRPRPLKHPTIGSSSRERTAPCQPVF